jgi:hypothetical protein
MKRIFKYEIPIQHIIHIELPQESKIISFQNQNEIACIWAIVDNSFPLESRTFILIGTGQELSESCLNYIGTCQMMGGNLVWHLFELISE